VALPASQGTTTWSVQIERFHLPAIIPCNLPPTFARPPPFLFAVGHLFAMKAVEFSRVGLPRVSLSSFGWRSVLYGVLVISSRFSTSLPTACYWTPFTHVTLTQRLLFHTSSHCFKGVVRRCRLLDGQPFLTASQETCSKSYAY